MGKINGDSTTGTGVWWRVCHITGRIFEHVGERALPAIEGNNPGIPELKQTVAHYRYEQVGRLLGKARPMDETLTASFI